MPWHPGSFSKALYRFKIFRCSIYIGDQPLFDAKLASYRICLNVLPAPPSSSKNRNAVFGACSDQARVMRDVGLLCSHKLGQQAFVHPLCIFFRKDIAAEICNYVWQFKYPRPIGVCFVLSSVILRAFSLIILALAMAALIWRYCLFMERLRRALSMAPSFAPMAERIRAPRVNSSVDLSPVRRSGDQARVCSRPLLWGSPAIIVAAIGSFAGCE